MSWLLDSVLQRWLEKTFRAELARLKAHLETARWSPSRRRTPTRNGGLTQQTVQVLFEAV